jgi:hypothetical protein
VEFDFSGKPTNQALTILRRQIHLDALALCYIQLNSLEANWGFQCQLMPRCPFQIALRNMAGITFAEDLDMSSNFLHSHS